MNFLGLLSRSLKKGIHLGKRVAQIRILYSPAFPPRFQVFQEGVPTPVLSSLVIFAKNTISGVSYEKNGDHIKRVFSGTYSRQRSHFGNMRFKSAR